MFSRSYSTHIHHMYTCDRQTAETVYHGVKMSLETDPAREHSFFISSPAQTSFAFPLLSMNDGKKKNRRFQRGRTAFQVWNLLLLLASWPVFGRFPFLEISSTDHDTEALSLHQPPLSPVPLSALDAQETTEHSQNSVSSLCLLTDLFSNSIK